MGISNSAILLLIKGNGKMLCKFSELSVFSHSALSAPVPSWFYMCTTKFSRVRHMIGISLPINAFQQIQTRPTSETRDDSSEVLHHV